MKKILLFLGLVFLTAKIQAQFTTPTIDGVIGANEYGVHTDGSNQQSNNLVWYVTWDNTNLYIATGNNDNAGNAMMFIIDYNPIAVVNGGTDANGSLISPTYDNVTANFPFRADFWGYLKPGYDDYKTSNGSGGWNTSITNSLTKNYNGTNKVFEIRIPWAAITGGGRPTSFNFVCYAQYNGGLFGQIPTANPGGNTNNVTFPYYQTVTSTNDVTSTKPFSRNSIATSGTATLSTAGIFHDVTVNGGTTTVSAAYSITGTVVVPSGTLASGGNITLVSDANGTASVGNSAGTISGNVTVQRFIPAGNRRFRFLSHPFSTSRPLNILTGLSYTGQGGTVNGFTHTTTTNNASAFGFTTANANGALVDGGWSAVTNATTSNWGVGQGLRILVRGALNEGLNGNPYTPSATTIGMSGTLNVGNVNVPIVLGGSGSTQNFNFVGNPYASPVNIGSLIRTNAAISNKNIYFRNPVTNGYITVNTATSQPGENYVMQSNSSFFVVANSATNISFTEASKATTASSDVVFRTQNTLAKNIFGIDAYLGSDMYDNTLFTFNEKALANYDKLNDGIKMLNDNFSMYALSKDNVKLSYDERPFEENSIIPLGVQVTSGRHTVTLKMAYNTIEQNKYEVILLDKLTNTQTVLTEDATYSFVVDQADPATTGENRLVLLLNKKAPITVLDALLNETFNATIQGSNIIANQLQVKISNPALEFTTVKLVNQLGQIVASSVSGNTANQIVNFNTSSCNKGNYFIEVLCGKEKKVLKAAKL